MPLNGREVKLVWADSSVTSEVHLSVQAHSPRGQRLAGENGLPGGRFRQLDETARMHRPDREGAAKAGRQDWQPWVRWSVQTSIADDWQAIKEH